MCLFRSDPQPVSFSKGEMDCRRHSIDLWLVEDERRSVDAPKKIADCSDHRIDHQYLHSTEGFGSAPLFRGWVREHSSGLKEDRS